jgi:nickel/cobalt transporter (NicO) family protein
MTGWRSMIGPGLAGGMVPTPSALIVLLGGVALGRAWFGVLLVVGYGIGMSVTLVGAGYLLLRARKWVEARTSTPGWRRLERVATTLPFVTASLVMLGGASVAWRALSQTV